jgi:hypothetical protein
MDIIQTSITHNSENAMLMWTAVSACATIAYVIVSAILLYISISTLRLTRKIVSTTNRPFIAVDSIECNFSNEKIKYPPTLLAKLKNIGSLPARNVRLTLTGKVNNSSITLHFPENGYWSLFPNIVEPVNFQIENSKFIEAVLFPINPNEILLKIEYQGITEEKYLTNNKYFYDLAYSKLSITDCKWK